MNSVIYKYPLEITDEQTVMLPEGARVLSVANQAETLVLYAHVDPRKPATTAVRVLIFGTGNPRRRCPIQRGLWAPWHTSIVA